MGKKILCRSCRAAKEPDIICPECTERRLGYIDGLEAAMSKEEGDVVLASDISELLDEVTGRENPWS